MLSATQISAAAAPRRLENPDRLTPRATPFFERRRNAARRKRMLDQLFYYVFGNEQARFHQRVLCLVQLARMRGVCLLGDYPGSIIARARPFAVTATRLSPSSRAISSGDPPRPGGGRLGSLGARSARASEAGSHRCASPDQVSGPAWSGAVTHSRLAGLIANFAEGFKFTPIPRFRRDFAGAAPGCRYEEKLAALTSSELRRQIAAAGIASGRFADVARRRESSGLRLDWSSMNPLGILLASGLSEGEDLGADWLFQLGFEPSTQGLLNLSWGGGGDG